MKFLFRSEKAISQTLSCPRLSWLALMMSSAALISAFPARAEIAPIAASEPVAEPPASLVRELPSSSTLSSDLSNPEELLSNGVNDLEMDTSNEGMGIVTNVSQLRDVQPTDWAYQALDNLVSRYGCIAGYPDGTFRGNRALTRYEFAAGLNACLQQIEKLIGSTDGVTQQDLATLQRLINEFGAELTALRTRVDGLEGRVGFLENHQFSTTTKLFGQAIVGLQGRSPNSFNSFTDRISDQGTNITLTTNVQLSLFTQLSPRSLLLTGLAAGNATGGGVPSLTNYTGLSYESDTGNNDIILSDLTYRQLIGNNFAFIVGPAGVNPVNVFRGSNRVESAGSGPISRFAQRNPIIAIGGGDAGVGFDWQISNRVSLQGVYAARLANNPVVGGLFGSQAGETVVGAQLAIAASDRLDFGLQYLNAYSPFGRLNTGVGDDSLAIGSGPELRAPLQTNAFGASLEWQVTPRVTFGGWGGYTTSNLKDAGGTVETVNWMAYLNFPDLFGEGNLGGLYVGQPPRITSSNLPAGRNVPDFISLGGFGNTGGQPGTTTHVEAFYRFRVSDNITLTPGVVVIFNPGQNSANDTITIGALRTTFTF